MKSWNDQRETIALWYRYASPSRTKNICFLIPFYTPDDESIAQEVQEKLNDHKICANALMNLFDLGQHKWTAICNLAKSNKSSQHGNKGKANRKAAEDDPRTLDLHQHFAALIELTEVQATRFVRERTGEVSERDANDNNVFLPAFMGK